MIKECGHYMPEKYKVEEWMLSRMRELLKRTYNLWLQSKSEATLSLLLIRLYEVGVAFYGYYFNSNQKANFGALRFKVGKSGSIRLKDLRNDLVHNMENVRNFNLTVLIFIYKIDNDLLDTVYSFCTGEQSAIYSEISSYLGCTEVIDEAYKLLDKIEDLDDLDNELSEDVYDNLPTLIKGDASLKQLLPILDMSVKKLLRGEN